MEKRRRRYRVLLAGFFLFMMFCTVASRIYDSVTVPRVLTSYATKKAVQTVVTGSGTVKEQETAFCSVYPGLRVESVAVTEGSRVKAGDELFRFQMASVSRKKEELERELQKLRLNLESEQISAETYSQVSQSELAARELSLAQRELAEGQQEYEEKRLEHEDKMNQLWWDFEDRQQLTEEELMRQQGQQIDAVHSEIRSARLARDQALREAERKTEDLQAQLERTEDETARENLEKQLARAQEDLEDLEAEWEVQLDDMENSRDLAEEQWDRIQRGETSSQEALRESYEAAAAQEEESWAAEEEKLKALQRSLEDAQWNAEVAVKNDAYAALSRQQQERLSEISCRLLEMDIENKEEEIGEVDAILEAEGRVAADRDGTVVAQEVAAGRVSTGEERLSIAYGSVMLEAEFDKEGQELSVGDLLTVAIPGTGRSVEAKIGEMNLLGGETGILRADLADLSLPIGTVTTYECRKQSEPFPKVIPLDALRKDMMGYFCLAARPERAILGEEYRAERVSLTVLYQGETDVAVDGLLYDADLVITDSNRIIAAGDRVRPVDRIER